MEGCGLHLERYEIHSERHGTHSENYGMLGHGYGMHSEKYGMHSENYGIHSQGFLGIKWVGGYLYISNANQGLKFIIIEMKYEHLNHRAIEHSNWGKNQNIIG